MRGRWLKGHYITIGGRVIPVQNRREIVPEIVEEVRAAPPKRVRAVQKEIARSDDPARYERLVRMLRRAQEEREDEELSVLVSLIL